VLTATGFFLFFVFFYHALLILIVKYIIVYNLRHGKYGFIVKVLSSNVPDDGYSRNVFSFLYTMYYIQARFYTYIFFIFALISLLIWLKQYFLKLLSVLILGMSLIHLGSRLHIVTRRVSYKKQELLTLCEQLSSPLVFGGVHVAYIFRFLCCPIICLYVLSSVLGCPLRFTHKNDGRFVFTPLVCRRDHVLFSQYVFVAYSGAKHGLYE
jgi:hypothetical protein